MDAGGGGLSAGAVGIIDQSREAARLAGRPSLVGSPRSARASTSGESFLRVGDLCPSAVGTFPCADRGRDPVTDEPPRPPVSCELCAERSPQDEAAAHVDACLDDALDEQGGRPVPKRGGGQAYHVLVEGRGVLGHHVLHLEVRGDASFHALDSVLRERWVECCGHLSLFRVDGKMFYRTEESARQFDARSMDARFGRVLDDGESLEYEYDFGSTTFLRGTVVSSRGRATSGEPVRVLAVNEPPEHACSTCGDAVAGYVCRTCMHQGDPFLCEPCALDHGCDPFVILGIENSPRTGVCGYGGPPPEPPSATIEEGLG